MIGIYHDVYLKVAHPTCVIKYNKCFSQHIFRKDRATCFGCKRIAVMRTELQDTKGGLIVIRLEISAFTLKLLVYCKNV